MITTESFLTFSDLQEANRVRGEEWTKGAASKPGTEFAVIELGGEAGELVEAVIDAAQIAAAVGKLQNWAKKQLRFDHGMPGGVEALQNIAEEGADVVICVSLLFNKLKLDLGDAVQAKFNKTSAKHGFKTTLEKQVRSVFSEGEPT